MQNAELSLVELCTKTKEKIEELNYSKVYQLLTGNIFNKLLGYARFKGITQMTTQLQFDFIRDNYRIDMNGKYSKHIAIRSTQLLLDYQNLNHFSIKRTPEIDYPENWSQFLNEFYDSTKLNKATSSLKTYRYFLMNIATYFDGLGLSEIAQISRQTIDSFTLSLKRFSSTTANRHISLLSKILKYAYENRYMNEDLSACCTTTRIKGKIKIPHVLEEYEIENILSRVDRSSTFGKRDYAVLILVARTGLRSGDIRRLKFNNIRWDTNTIEITQNKTGKPLTLPLIEEVGLALIDYLKNARPKVDNSYIFLKLRAPNNEFRGNMGEIVRKYMAEDKLQRPRGLHIFRSSLASSMLKNETPLVVIADFLGHSDSDSAKHYLKIDVTQLRSCALEVPNV